MSDMTYPIDPAIMERAARAGFAAAAANAAKEIGLDMPVTWDEHLTDADREYELARHAAALEAAAPLIAAKALREAADDLERRINEPGLILAADKYGGYHAGERARGQREVDVLRARADALGACCPHPKCPGGSLCCCADALEAGQS